MSPMAGAPPPPPPSGPPAQHLLPQMPQQQQQYGQPQRHEQHPLLGGPLPPPLSTGSESCRSLGSGAASSSGSGQPLNLSMLAGSSPLTDLLLLTLQNQNQNSNKGGGGAAKKRKGGNFSSQADRRPRAVHSEQYPAGRDTIATLPDEDVLALLEHLEPVAYNRYNMDGYDRATRNACLMLALDRGLHDKVVTMNRTQHEASCVHRYMQLGRPLNGKTPEEVVRCVMKTLAAPASGVGYSVHTTTDGRQYLHNGMTSKWLDERIGLNAPPPMYSLHISAGGQSYISNGLQSAWAEDLFKERPARVSCIAWARHATTIHQCCASATAFCKHAECMVGAGVLVIEVGLSGRVLAGTLKLHFQIAYVHVLLKPVDSQSISVCCVTRSVAD